MAETKTGTDQRIRLPPALVDVLRWHADHLAPGQMRDSDLLFPAHDGALR